MRYTNRLAWLICALILVCLLAGSLYDLPIAKFLYDPDSLYASIVYAYGTLPMLWGLASAGFLMIDLAVKNKSRYPALAFILGLICIAGPYIYSCAASWRSFSTWTIFFYSFILVYLPSWMYYQIAKKSTAAKIRKAVFFLLSVCILSFLAVSLIKEVWIRPRYRITTAYSQIPFVDWWTPHSTAYGTFGKAFKIDKDQFLSFPSAHTAAAACLLCLSSLSSLSKSFRPYKNVLVIIAVFFTVLVGFGRMAAGAHYLSDVSVGFGITFAVYMLSFNFIYSRR